MKEKLKFYYWGHPIIRYCFNFGDFLTPMLLEYYCSCGEVEMATSAADADIFCVGSIIEHIPHDKYAVVLGAGMIREGTPTLPYARYYAVRGPHTKSCLGIQGELPLGDPGLLVPYVMPKCNIPCKTGPIGIVPHFSQYANPRLDCYRNNPKYKVINVRAEAKYVIDEICQCSSIISSSLHGLIIADAYGIPNVRLVFETPLYGGDFKFNDYNASIGRNGAAAMTIEPEGISENIKYDTAYLENIPAKQKELDEAFRKFVVDIPLLKEICDVAEMRNRECRQQQTNILNRLEGIEAQVVKSSLLQCEKLEENKEYVSNLFSLVESVKNQHSNYVTVTSELLAMLKKITTTDFRAEWVAEVSTLLEMHYGKKDARRRESQLLLTENYVRYCYRLCCIKSFFSFGKKREQYKRRKLELKALLLRTKEIKKRIMG